MVTQKTASFWHVMPCCLVNKYIALQEVMAEVNEYVEVDTGTGWVRAELWLKQWDSSKKQPNLLSFADSIFFSALR